MINRLPLLAACTLAASVGCSSSNRAPSADGDGGVVVDGDGINDDGGEVNAVRRVDTSLYFRTSLLKAVPEGPVVLNGLNLGPLTVASIDPAELAELNSDALASNGENMGEAARQVLAYAYSCALPASSSMRLEIGGETWEFNGLLGLAPEWETGACDVECQEWVSACILARTNQFGTEVRLSLRGDHPALATSTAIRDQYTLREGSFYGNIFTDADQIKGNAYACAGGKGSAMWELTNRFCSAIGDGCPIDTVADCNFDEFACDTGFEACTSWTACSEWNADGLPTKCHSERHKCETQAPTGTPYGRIITAYIEQPIVAPNNLVCEEGESGGSDCDGHWAVRYGSGCQEDSGGLSVHDSTGNIAIVGRFIGDIDFGGGHVESTNLDNDIDLFITNVDKDGNTNWSVRIDAQSQGMIRSVATDSKGDVIVAGHFSGAIDLGAGSESVAGMSYFVAKYAGGTGNLIWSQVHQSNGFWGTFDDLENLPDVQVALDSNDGIVAAFTVKGTVDLGLGAGNPGSGSILQRGILVASYDSANGTRDWHTTIDGDDDEDVHALVLDEDNNIVLGGTFMGTVNIGATTLSNPQGAMLLRTEGFVAKLSPLGSPIWGAHLAAIGTDATEIQVLGLAVGANKEIVLTGTYRGKVSVAGSPTLESLRSPEDYSRDGLVAKLDSAGARVWVKSFGDTRDDSAMAVAWNGSDSYVVATRVTADYGTTAMVEDTIIDSGDSGDIVMIRYLSDGTAQSVTQRGGPVAEAPKGLVAMGSKVIMTGQFMGTLRFSGTYLTNSGGSSQQATPQDIFLTTVENLP